jgi:hypothetical protein
MDITRNLLANTNWQQANGSKILITKMDDKHLRNSIAMLKRQMKLKVTEEHAYALALLEAEQTFRKTEKNGQQMFDLPISKPVQPPTTHPIIKSMATTIFRDRKLMESVEAIGMKHHGAIVDRFWDVCSDPRDYGYDGDCW